MIRPGWERLEKSGSMPGKNPMKTGSAHGLIIVLTVAALPACRVQHGISPGHKNLSEYLSLASEDVRLLRDPDSKGIYEHAQHRNFGGFDLFTEMDSYSGTPRLYVARDGVMLAVIDPNPGTVEVYGKRIPPFEPYARAIVKFPTHVIYRGDSFTVEDHGWDGPDLVYENVSDTEGSAAYRPGGRVLYSHAEQACTQAFPALESVACCIDGDGKRTAWVFNVSRGWSAVAAESRAAKSCGIP